MTDKLKSKLKAMNACSNAVDWVGERSLARAWRECPRADWMLWLVGKMCDQPGWPTCKQLVLAACDCAETVSHLVPAGETRPAEAIKTTRAWCRGRATLAEVKAAAVAADAAEATYTAATAAEVKAAAVAAAAAADAADAAAAVDAADAAVDAVAADDIACAATDAVAAYVADARTKAHKKMCALIRKRLKPGKLQES